MERALLWVSSGAKARWLPLFFPMEEGRTIVLMRMILLPNDQIVFSSVQCEQLVARKNGLRSSGLLNSERTGSPSSIPGTNPECQHASCWSTS